MVTLTVTMNPDDHSDADKWKVPSYAIVPGDGVETSAETCDTLAAGWFRVVKSGDVDQIKLYLNRQLHVDIVNELGQTALHVAVIIERLDIIRLLVSAGASVNHRGPSSSSPLHLAANVNSLELVEYLLRNGADPNATLDDGTSVLHCACQTGDACQVAATLLKLTPSLALAVRHSKAGVTGISALHDSVECGDVKTVRLLLDSAVDVNITTSASVTPLHIAARHGYIDIVSELVSHGAKVDVAAIDSKGCGVQPLHCAVESNHTAVAELLLAAGADVNACRQHSGRDNVTSVNLGAMRQNVDVLKFLLSVPGVAVNVCDSDNASALHVAARGGFADVAELLLQHGVDVDIGMTSGQSSSQTALHCAVRYHQHEIAHMLLAAGASINATEKMSTVKTANDDSPEGDQTMSVDGYTALHWAVENGDLEMVCLLLDYDADTSIAAAFDKHSGVTALHLASQDGYVRIAEQLVQSSSCDLNPLKCTENRDNITPLHQAVYNGHVATARLLIERGCDVNWQAGNGYSALHYAAQQGNIELTNLMLRRGGNIRLVATAGDQRNITCLHLAVQSGNVDVLCALLDAGCDIEACKTMGSVGGVTALHQAVYQEKADIAQVLLERGAGVDAKMSGWYSPLHIAAERGSMKLVELLLQYRADVDETAQLNEHSGLTPLHVAAQHGQADIIVVLVGAGAQLEAVRSFSDRSMITPLLLAAENGYVSSVQTLIDLGAIINARDSLGFTALHLAAQYEFPDVVRTLIAARANTRIKTASGLTVTKLVEQSGNSVLLEVYRTAKKKATIECHQSTQRKEERKYRRKRSSRFMSLLCGLNKS